MFRKKCLLIIGGSGQLGSKVVDKFVKGGFGRKWRVFNIDLKENK
jgi:nucleoside-diphosphate-sugar epimerase